MSTAKINWTTRLYKAVKNFRAAAMELHLLTQEFFDNTYNTGGDKVLVDSDVTANFDCSAADLTAIITVSQNVDLLLDNGTPATGDYMSSLNKIVNTRK